MNEQRVYESILGEGLRFGRLFKSPFRDDKNPSLSFYKSKTGRIRWKDFGTDEPSGGLYQFVGKHIGTDNLDAIKDYLRKDKFEPHKVRVFTDSYRPTRENKLEIKTKSWNQHELDYWESYGISKKTLKTYNVFPLKHFYVNDIKYDREENELLFAEIVNEHIKIYSPLSKTRKWKSNTTKTDIFGAEQLKFKSDILIITKSLKDVMVLHELGFEAISPQSETSDISKEIKEEVLPRYRYVCILFDNDETGLRKGEAMSLRYNATNLIIPTKTGCKDISDLVQKYKQRESVINQIKTKLKEKAYEVEWKNINIKDNE